MGWILGRWNLVLLHWRQQSQLARNHRDKGLSPTNLLPSPSHLLALENTAHAWHVPQNRSGQHRRPHPWTKSLSRTWRSTAGPHRWEMGNCNPGTRNGSARLGWVPAPMCLHHTAGNMTLQLAQGPCNPLTQYPETLRLEAAPKPRQRSSVNNANFREKPHHVTSLFSKENSNFQVLLICFLLINTVYSVVTLCKVKAEVYSSRECKVAGWGPCVRTG